MRCHFLTKQLKTFVTLLLLSNCMQAQKVQLPIQAKFILGDNPAWAHPAYNDASWEDKNLGQGFSAPAKKDSVYAWYRIKVHIPSSLKKEVNKRGVLKLSLGRIDDADQTFFNGKLAGQTGGMPPQYFTKYNVDRYYYIPAKEVLWDQDNLVAVRLFSPDYGGVGMYQGDYYVASIQFYDSIVVQHKVTKTANNGFRTSLLFTNNGNERFDGKIVYTISDIKNKILFTETVPVNLSAQMGSSTSIEMPDFQPGITAVLNIHYGVKDDSTAATLEDQWLYLANDNIDIAYGPAPLPVVQDKVQAVFTSTALENSRLQGYLASRMQKNLQERLLKVDEEGLIGGYWKRPGTHPWIGEHAGKYLETACNTWRNNPDTALKKQMDRIMYKLVNAQTENGYLGTYLPANYWTSWDVWSHKYNLYGLLAYYKTTGYKPALDACIKMGDLLCKTFGYQPGQRDIINAGEHMGMAATSILDPMVELYQYTGDIKYLAFCYYLLDSWEQPNGPKIISAVLKTGKVTNAGNGKAYEMISNFTGLAHLYRVTGEERLLQTVITAWNDIIKNRLYITGTCSSHEYFKPEGILPAGEKDNMGEGCVTTTWIQLNQHLLAITGDMKYAEAIERSVYNHLLAAENPQTGCVSYYTPLMGKKPYSCDITCCTSSVPRGIALIRYFSFGKIKNSPSLLFYEPALYKDEIKTDDQQSVRLTLQVESSFPEKGGAGVIVTPATAASFTIILRVPSWCRSFLAKVGQEEYRQGKNEGQCIIHRRWNPGDKISISFEMPVQLLNGGKSYPGMMAFQRGPQILAMDEMLNHDFLQTTTLPGKDRWTIKPATGKTLLTVLPSSWIGKQAYPATVNGKAGAAVQQLILVPYADASQTGGNVQVWLPVKK
jgi:DUF1680 family protein